MKFSEYRRSLMLIELGVVTLPVNVIKCQYNPDYEDIWLKVCGDYKVSSTPFFHYLTTGKTEKYFELFKGYGRNEGWITRNIMKFNALKESIENNGITELPIVLIKPVIQNKYNSGFEIWEGHRRLSIALFNGENQDVLLCRIA